MGTYSCPSILYVWAEGTNKLTLPPEAGLPIGSDYTRFIIIELLIWNPNRLSGINIGGIGVEISTTTVPRPHHAASLATGDTFSTLITQSFEPWTSEIFSVELSCSSNCTQSAFSGDITIFSSFFRMNSIGRQIWLTKSSQQGQVVKTVDYRQFWSTHSQRYTSRVFSLARGDQLNLHCMSDISKYWYTPSIVCQAFLFYYPMHNANGVTVCGFQNGKSICGGKDSLLLDSPNPVPGTAYAFVYMAMRTSVFYLHIFYEKQ